MEYMAGGNLKSYLDSAAKKSVMSLNQATSNMT